MGRVCGAVLCGCGAVAAGVTEIVLGPVVGGQGGRGGRGSSMYE